MKKFVCLIAVLLSLLAVSSTVQAQGKKWDTLGIYIGIAGGYSLPNNMREDFEINDFDEGHSDFTFKKDGYLYGAKVGWLTPFTNRIMALEFEYNHIRNNMDEIKDSGSQLKVDAKMELDLFIFNVIARYPNGIFHPYVGIGAGYAYVRIDDIIVPAAGGIIPGTSKGVFAAQLMTGIDIDVTKNFIIGLRYKFVAPADIPVDTYLNTGGDTVDAKFRYSSHNFMISACFLF